MAVLQGDLRAKRASIDTGTGERRVSDTGRAKHIGRGTFVNWQDDLGISATEGEAKDIREKDAKFKEGIAERYKPLDEAEGKLVAAEGEVAAGYDTIESDLKRLKTWYGWNPNVTGAQAQAKAVKTVKGINGGPLPSMMTPSDADTDESFAAKVEAAAKEREARVRAVVQANPELYGDETGSWDPYRGETKFKKLPGGAKAKVRGALTSNLNTIETNKQMLRDATASIGTQRGVLQGHRDVVKGYEDLDKQQWAKVHSDYKRRQETMKKILGGIDFG